MSESLEFKDVQEQFVNGCMVIGLAYSRDEARGYFTEWLAETIRQAKAEAWETFCRDAATVGYLGRANAQKLIERNPYADEAT